MSTGAVVTALRNAIESHAPVRVGYADASGETIVIHIEPMRMGGGTVTAFDFGLEQVRSLTVSRIAAVLPA
jgi:predicted DNA-binding transcriptional regulator YafY